LTAARQVGRRCASSRHDAVNTRINPWTEAEGTLNDSEHAESAQRYGRGAKSKHFTLPQTGPEAGPEASLGSCRGRLKRLCSLDTD
jgi:hypothetical protein